MALPSSGYALATPQNPSTSLTDFSFIIDLSLLPQSWWNDVNTTDPTRGRAAKNDGSTELAVDWITFDNVAKTGLARILFTGSKSSTIAEPIRIYPPNTRNTAYAATDTYGQYNAYDSGWLAYYPLEEDPTGGSIYDRTTNQNTLTISGTVDSGDSITGQIGQALAFDGVFEASATITTGITDFPITIISNMNSGSVESCIIGIGNSLDNSDMLVLRKGSGYARLVNYVGSFQTVIQSDSVLTDNVWGFVSGVYDETAGYRLNVNGVEKTSSAVFGFPSSITSISLGKYAGTNTVRRVGSLDDVSFHSVNRHTDYLNYEYSQTSDNSTFWGTPTWESGGASFDLNDITLSSLAIDTITGQNISNGELQALTMAAAVLGTMTGGASSVGELNAINLSGAVLGGITGQCTVNGTFNGVSLSSVDLDGFTGSTIISGTLGGVTLSALILGKLTGEGGANVLNDITLSATVLGSFTGQCDVNGGLDSLILSGVILDTITESGELITPDIIIVPGEIQRTLSITGDIQRTVKVKGDLS